MKTVDLILYSDYSPRVCLAKIEAQIDLDQFTLLSFSGYKGDKPIVGRVAANDFRLHRRRYWHNSFGPILFGRAIPDGSGTRLEAYWSMHRWTRLGLRVWLAIAILIGAPFLFGTIHQFATGKPMQEGELWMGILFPICLILMGRVIVPLIGTAFTGHEKTSVVVMLTGALDAGRRPSEGPPRNWKSSVD